METNLISQIMAIDPAKVKTICFNRSIPRKEQAKLTRDLFKLLGLKGISVTTPNYSMAHVVDVQIPSYKLEPGDYLLNGINYEHHCYSDMPEEVPARAKHLRHYGAEKHLEKILLAAFPAHNDRSDYQTDYFDSCWSIS